MAVLGITPNLVSRDPRALANFYAEVFGLDATADMEWIAFLAAPKPGKQRLQLARHGGSGQNLPSVSIEVDDLDEVLARLKRLDHAPVYGPTTEPWGIRRFFLRDPDGNTVNVATHSHAD